MAAREDTLARRLSTRQVGMIALGGAIGTGFFLGSGAAVRLAGPGAILAYLLGEFITLAISGSLAEMAVVHPMAGSFGVYKVSAWSHDRSVHTVNMRCARASKRAQELISGIYFAYAVDLWHDVASLDH